MTRNDEVKESTGCRLPQWQEAVFQNAFKLGITYGLAADLKMLLTARRSETALISGPVLYHPLGFALPFCP